MKTWQQAPRLDLGERTRLGASGVGRVRWAKSRLSGVLKVVLILAGYCLSEQPSLTPSSLSQGARVPLLGNRGAVWIVASSISCSRRSSWGADLRGGQRDSGLEEPGCRYERLAKEVTKVTVILYSMTALTGGLFIFVLLATYPQLTAWLIGHFFAVFAVMYPLLFIFETIVLYLYWYTWDAWQGPKKLRHIALECC